MDSSDGPCEGPSAGAVPPSVETGGTAGETTSGTPEPVREPLTGTVPVPRGIPVGEDEWLELKRGADEPDHEVEDEPPAPS